LTRPDGCGKPASWGQAAPPRLPDVHALGRGPAHRRAFRNAEGFRELVEVRERAVDAPQAGRVRIDVHAPALVGIGARLAPEPRPTEEETLLGREAVDLFRGFVRARLLQRSERDAQAAEVGDVLALRQLALEVHAVEHGVAVELL